MVCGLQGGERGLDAMRGLGTGEGEGELDVKRWTAREKNGRGRGGERMVGDGGFSGGSGPGSISKKLDGRTLPGCIRQSRAHTPEATEHSGRSAGSGQAPSRSNGSQRDRQSAARQSERVGTGTQAEAEDDRTRHRDGRLHKTGHNCHDRIADTTQLGPTTWVAQLASDNDGDAGH
ncbi:uncharacterized protein LAESUDRAFT_814273 [Laetiporus sulphureus 93-53]|uniref:Uncharacterized protein n=1 Tax=Laetiporus sulphureus 93-53 TaxID=1314785 RepID=A0A165D2D4_9APHY|nr:uncharacterized protein LAESUDRAFT_814273 [Laetiporus sulphureus 93-53]KZT04015.1 hypothetical protein LAESUDRAFT_814273 [Laetiporus sulphureus 93-53]